MNVTLPATDPRGGTTTKRSGNQMVEILLNRFYVRDSEHIVEESEGGAPMLTKKGKLVVEWEVEDEKETRERTKEA